MTSELWIALLGFLTTSVGGVRWLLHVYFKQAKTIEDLRSKNENLAIGSLQEAVSSLKVQIHQHRADMLRMREDLQLMQVSMTRTSKDAEVIMQSMSTYIETTKRRIEQVETQIVQLGRALILVKGGKGNGEKN